jgi:hypothetical protein
VGRGKTERTERCERGGGWDHCIKFSSKDDLKEDDIRSRSFSWLNEDRQCLYYEMHFLAKISGTFLDMRMRDITAIKSHIEIRVPR